LLRGEISTKSSVKLTAKQSRFIAEYLIDLNATQASIRAGYSPKTAGVIGYENLKKPQIAAVIAKAQAQLSERIEVTIETVVAELAKLGFARLSEPPSASVKHGALVSLGRHLGMFVDRRVIEGSIEHRVALMTREERLARLEELLEGATQYLPLLEQAEADVDAAHDGEASEVPPTEG
jgi:phage terminase small subunit